MSDGAPTQAANELLTITASIVSAHLRHNKVAADALPGLITSVHQALANLGSEQTAEPAQGPAVSARRSVFPEYLICLEDGAKVKMLRPYLQRRFGLSPAAYRAKWGLPSDYPMVAPAYAARRSALARQFGLGSQRGTSSSEDQDQAPEQDVPEDALEDGPEGMEEEAAETAATAPGNQLDDAEWEQAAPSTEAAAPDQPGAEPDEDEVEYTAEAVFANFPQSAGAVSDSPSGAGRQKRKRFSDQMTRQMPARRKPKAT